MGHKGEYGTHVVTQWPITKPQLTDLEQQHPGEDSPPSSREDPHSRISRFPGFQDSPRLGPGHAPTRCCRTVTRWHWALGAGTICYNEISSSSWRAARGAGGEERRAHRSNTATAAAARPRESLQTNATNVTVYPLTQTL